MPAPDVSDTDDEDEQTVKESGGTQSDGKRKAVDKDHPFHDRRMTTQFPSATERDPASCVKDSQMLTFVSEGRTLCSTT